MKKTILLPCFLLGALSLTAQTQHFNFFKKNTPNKHRLLINGLLSKQPVSETSQKPTGTQQRVIAQGSVDDSNMETDSATYKYSGTRGSKYTHNNIEGLDYGTSFYSDYFPSNFINLEIPSVNLQADSIKSFYQDEITEVSKAFYRNDNKTDSFVASYFGSPTPIVSKNLHSFNSQGFLTQVIELNNASGGTSFDTSQLTKYFYNSAGTVILSDTVFEQDINGLEPYYVNKYHYNAQNLLDTITSYTNNAPTYDLNEKVVIQYNGTNQMIKIVSSEYENDMVTSIMIDSFGYNGTLPYFTLFQETDIDINSQDTSAFKIVKYIGSNNLPDSGMVSDYYMGTWEDDGLFTYYYNSYNNPDSIIAHNADGTFAGQYNFYYELYDDGLTSIKNANNNNDYNIYPNPFNNQLNINWKTAQANQAKISLVNVLGQTVYSSNKTLVTGNNVLELPKLNDGNYILLIQDSKGATWKSQLVKN